MAKVAKVPELKQAFTTHREETQGQIVRLEQVFEMLGKRPQAKPCEAINGIVAEGEETIEDFGESAAIDTGMVQRAKRSNTMRWRVTAHSLRGPVSSTCRRPQPC